MDIGSENALSSLETTDNDVFSDLHTSKLSENFANGGSTAADGLGLEVLNVSRIGLDDSLSNSSNEVLDIVSVSCEVSLGVYLEKNAHIAVNDSGNDTLCCSSAALLSLCSETLFTEKSDCLFLIAVSLFDSLLALHHANAGCFHKFLDFSR